VSFFCINPEFFSEFFSRKYEGHRSPTLLKVKVCSPFQITWMSAYVNRRSMMLKLL